MGRDGGPHPSPDPSPREKRLNRVKRYKQSIVMSGPVLMGRESSLFDLMPMRSENGPRSSEKGGDQQAVTVRGEVSSARKSANGHT